MRKGTKFQTTKQKKKIPGKRPPKAGLPKVVRKGMRCRSCCWTLWDPSDEDKTAFKGWEQPNQLPKEINYSCGQLELGKGSGGRFHIQGYSEFIKKMSLSGIKRVHLRKGSLHVERRRGTQTQAIDYTKKKDTRVTGENSWSYEAGSPKRQGVHKDNIKDCVEQIDQGMCIDDLEEEFPVQMTLHKNKLIERFIAKKRQRMLKPCKNNVHIFVGPSGTGKTTTAWSKWPDAYKGVWPTGGRWWWPDYKGQHHIIFDEFRGNISYQQMLALMDIWPMSIEYKGGNTQNVSRHIVITTVRDPCEWYPGVEDKSELQRRINENCTIIDFSPGGTYPKFNRTTRKGNFIFNTFVPKDINQ